ncbi:MAG TPA: sigma-70 family RNA polymerase sigma factor [Phycisphaerae bacterium]|jgi:RNA polymerase sigma-70 factor (ECF subfamily)|nr:sigma-70 family RNA polymerase sigma factor [Phycisphaerae bacterium]
MAGQQPADSLFEAAVHANMGRLIALARAMLGAPTRDSKSPEDLVQDALLKLYRGRASYDWTDGGWSLMAKSVARNVISCRRRKLGHSLDADEALSDSLGREQDPAERAISAETTAVMRARIEALPESWREALVLREQQGLAYKEIAELLSATEAQVKTWLHRARARLLGQLAEDEERKPGAPVQGVPLTGRPLPATEAYETPDAGDED